jgi:hypothetical protein
MTKTMSAAGETRRGEPENPGEAPREPPPGLECRGCGCHHFEVLYTRPRLGGIMRVRQCRYCGKRLVTRETPG